MRILGVDPSLKATGYGIVEPSGNDFKLIETGTIEPKRTDCIENRLYKIHKNLEELILEYQPNILVLEKVYTHHTYPTTGIILGHVRGVICLLCAQNNIELSEYSVKRIRKSLIGNGNATKQQTRRFVAHLLNIDEKKLSLDASDALALALGYLRMQGVKI